MDRDQLVEHLKFAAELGVPGVSRDPNGAAMSFQKIINVAVW